MSCLGLKRPKFAFINSLFSRSKKYNSECRKVLQVPKLIGVESRILKVILTIRIRRKLCFFFLCACVCEEALFRCTHFIYCTLMRI